MLIAEPRSIFSRAFTVKERSHLVAEIDMSWTREAGTFRLKSRTFKMGRDGWASGDFYLERGSQRLASADKVSAFKRRFVLEVDGATYELRAISALARAFELVHEGHRVGTLMPISIWKRGLRANLPEELAPEVKIFITWLVLLIWRRQRNNSSS